MAEGAWVWYDLLTPDVPGALGFYSRVFGWGTRPYADGGAEYPMFTVGAQGAHGGAVPLRSHDLPPHWLGYIEVADLEGVVRKAEQRGGKLLVPPSPVSGIGRYAMLSDPQGGVFDVFQPARGPAEPMEGPGNIVWHELACDDPEAAFEFYAALFGWEQGPTRDRMGRLYQVVVHEGREIGGIYQAAGGMPTAWTHFVQVDDVGGALRRAVEEGGKRLFGPVTVADGSRLAGFTDPQGAPIALVQPAAHQPRRAS